MWRASNYVCGVESDIFNTSMLTTPETSVVVEGLSVGCSIAFIDSIREVYIIRKAINCAKDALLCYSENSTHSALGSVIEELLGIIDTSVDNLRDSILKWDGRKSICYLKMVTTNQICLLHEED